jgi:MerR family transcriptional regulator, repressor of the yfmOP operon
MASTATPAALRIGDVAKRVGTTPRTIRYYEEMGLLGEAATRERGAHRLYTESEVERLQEVIRLRDGLGVSLDQLRALLEAEEARSLLRKEWEHAPDADRRREILLESLGHLDSQLDLVRARAQALERLEGELKARRRRVRARLRELDRASTA